MQHDPIGRYQKNELIDSGILHYVKKCCRLMFLYYYILHTLVGNLLELG